MDAMIRQLLSRAGMLAAAVAAFGLAGSVTAQPVLMPPKPLPSPQVTGWPDYPPVKSASDLADSSPQPLPLAPDAPLPPTGAPVGTPVWPVTPGAPPTTSAPMPRPIAPIGPPVWMVTPQAAGRPMAGNPGDRNPRDFGQGWKGVINQQVLGREAPAAMLAMPRGAIIPGARPDWSWHGYDGWNTGNRPVALAEAITQASAFETDMAPYMKYAHLWKLSSSAVGGRPKPSNGSNSIIGSPADGTGPNLNSTSGIYSPAVEWRGTISPEPTADSGATRVNYSGPLPTRPSQPAVEPLPPPGSTGFRIPLNVRERISEICVNKSRNLVVEQQSPIHLRISFLVRTPADAEMLTAQLAALPELGPYKVDFEVQIGQ